MYSFDQLSLRYLTGASFSTGARIEFRGNGSRGRDRIAFLESYCRGKQILHVGCADHLSVLERKRAAGVWLHGRLSEVATRCAGVDIDGVAVQALRKSGFPDTHCLDIATAELPDELRDHWDVVVLGEVLEHVDNPVAFLTAARRRLGCFCERLVITVPNATRAENLIAAIGRRECINTDHRFWFTPFTLAKIATRAGWQPISFDFLASQPRRLGDRLRPKRLAESMFPPLRDVLVMDFANGASGASGE